MIDYTKYNNKLINLIFRNKNDQKIYVEADFFLFCMGGIENARFAEKLFKDSNLKNSEKEIIEIFRSIHIFTILHILIKEKFFARFADQ